MRIRRCTALFLEPRETLDLDLAALLSGDDPLKPHIEWIALAPHLSEERVVDSADVGALGAISETLWMDREQADRCHGRETISRLLEHGLLVSDGEHGALVNRRDQQVRDTYWWPLAALAHGFGRWSGRSTQTDPRLSRFRSVDEMVEAYGPPPPAFLERTDRVERIQLPPTEPTALTRLLRSRVTCRNFDPDRCLSAVDLAHVLAGVFGPIAIRQIAPGTEAQKRASPSGGSLHPTEAYLLVRRVEGLPVGLYHYRSREHALDLLRGLDASESQRLAGALVADQDYLSDAAAFVVMSCRFRRSFWKYRNHPKAYRAAVLDVGHLSQNLYLHAAEAGIGAFVTAAINEAEIEAAFGLDPLQEGPLAVFGLGPTAPQRAKYEFHSEG